MDTFSARPERIIGNVALASLAAGIPLGLLISAIEAFRHPSGPFGVALVESIALGALVAPVCIFLCGLIVITPALALLRRFDLGGPFFVYAISIALAVPFFANGLLPGLAALVLALAASYVFCRSAYASE